MGNHHSYLANQYPYLFNTDEPWRYDVYNTMLFVYAAVDLAYSPSFETTDLSQLRRTPVRAQRTAWIGNRITTWKRELSSLREDTTAESVDVKEYLEGRGNGDGFPVSRRERRAEVIPPLEIDNT